MDIHLFATGISPVTSNRSIRCAMEECVMTFDSNNDDESPNLEISVADEVVDIQNVPPSEVQAPAQNENGDFIKTQTTSSDESRTKELATLEDVTTSTEGETNGEGTPQDEQCLALTGRNRTSTRMRRHLSDTSVIAITHERHDPDNHLAQDLTTFPAVNTGHLRGPSSPGAPIPESEIEGARRESPNCYDVMVAVAAMESDSILGAHPKKAPDPEQELIRQLTEFKESLDDWRFDAFDFSRELARANQWVRWLRQDELIPRRWRGQPIDFPEHLYITFQPAPAHQLGSYTFGRSLGHGFKYTINLNPVAILRWNRSPAQTASVLLHEIHHLAEDLFFQRTGKERRGKGSYHLLEFRLRVQALGIPCTKDGREKGIVPDGPFDKFLNRHEIPRVHEYDVGEYQEPARLPKRISWRCACEDGVPLPVPRGSVIRVRCEDCNQRYQPPTLRQSMVDGRKTGRIVRK